MSELELVQGTEEWLRARCGSLGASQVHDAITRTKTGYGASRANLAAKMICERLTGVVEPMFTSAAMVHGTVTEPEARRAYAFYADAEVTEVGLVLHPTIKGTHASPDGLVGDKGLVEIKCPQPASHLETLLGRTVPAKYMTQMLWQLRCTGRDWCDFVSYSPSFPEELRLFVTRIERDDAMIEELETEVVAFLTELDARIADLTSRYGASLAIAA